MLSDEELDLRTEDLAQALETRIGGRQRRQDAEDLAAETAEHADARGAFDMAESIWAESARAGEGASEAPGASMDEERLKKIFDSATASQRKETTGNAKPSVGGEASLREAKAYTAADVHKWMAEVRARKNKQGQPAVRKAQLEMLQIVVDRVCAELEEGEAAAAPNPEAKRRRKGHAKETPKAQREAADPLIWCMHGGPGTGKSHVVKLVRELFTQVLGWEMGLD